jgi:hypothetical protein
LALRHWTSQVWNGGAAISDDSNLRTPETAWPVEGHFKCGDGFLITPDCLGQTFQSHTGSHALSLTLPTINTDTDAGWLRRPTWKFAREGEDRSAVPQDGFDWGSVAGGNKDAPIYAFVLQCVVHSELIAANEDQFHNTAREFGDELASWWTLVCDWLDVLTLQDFTSLGRSQRSILNDSIQMWSGDVDGIRRAGISYQVMTGVMRWVEVLDRQQLQAAMDLATTRRSPESEWLLLRDARSLLNAGEYRRAVIDACTAAELAAIALIDRAFAADGTTQVERKRDFDNHRGLSKLKSLHKKRQAAGRLPRRLVEDVAAPRNRAAHRGEALSDVHVKTAIATAAEVVDIAYPLNSIVPGIAPRLLRSSPQLGILPQQQNMYLTTDSGLSMRIET